MQKTASTSCITDIKQYMKSYNAAYYEANKDKIREQTKEYYKNNRDKARATQKLYRANNKSKWAEYLKLNAEKIAAYRSAYQITNAETIRARSAKWSRENPGKIKEYVKANVHQKNTRTARRRANKLKATPEWADAFIISEAYKLAQMRGRATGVIHHVDHVVPLQSRVVCGLHCEFNLRVIPRVENLSKNNRYWPDMP